LPGIDEFSHVSGHYRAVRWKEKLPDDETPLAVISSAVKANPALGSEIWDYIFNNLSYDKNAENDYPGVTWEQLKNNFGL
jgi:hypothetical protein